MRAVRWSTWALVVAAAWAGGAVRVFAQESDTAQLEEEADDLAGERVPRLIVRTDVGLLGLPNSGPNGGGGISIPIGGTGAGFLDAGGVELGVEVRASRWLAVDAATAWYRPELVVDRDLGPGTMVDDRSDDVDLRTLTLGLVVKPPRWRTDWARLAVGLLVSRATISSVPSDLGLSVDDGETCIGFDVRGDVLVSADRRWGFGGALAFVDIDPSFLDNETGDTGSLQISGLFLKLGARRAW